MVANGNVLTSRVALRPKTTTSTTSRSGKYWWADRDAGQTAPWFLLMRYWEMPRGICPGHGPIGPRIDLYMSMRRR